ncbi:MAG: hypothetical protein P4L86_17595, partial [Mycobacterium sp.]|nr:hypothetical protein [Mycobacterium sp.]
GNIGTLTLNAENTLGTNGNNTININSTAAFVVTNVNGQGGHDTINVNNTGALGSLNVSTGSGGSTVNVVADNEPVHIANNGLDTDNIGSTGGPGTLAGIQAPITITDLPSFISLNFHDELDATGQTWTLDTDNVADTASVAVTGSALVSYRPGDLSELTVNGGIGGNTFNVNDTANGVPTTINAGLTGTNTVNAFATGTGSTLNIDAQGSSSNAVNLGGLVAVGLQHFVDGATVVNVTDTTGLEAVTLDDSQDATSQTATLTDNGTTATVTGLAPATIKVADLGLSSLTIFGGSGGNTFTVDGTPANAPTTINSGTGDDTVNVWATTGPALLTINGQNGADTVNIGFFGSLAGILGPIAVTNAFDFTALNIDASADTNPHDINLIADPSDTTSTFTGLAPATITYTIGDISQIGLTLGNAGAGSNNLSVDFSNGNPIQFENNPGLIYDAGSGAANTLNLRGQLPAAFGGPGFASEVHDANGAGFGAISFTDHNSNASGLTYTGLAVDPINDTANATNYTFNDNAFPDATFAAVVGPVILGFNTIQFNSDTSTPPAQFTTTNISNKTNVVFNSNNTLIGQTGVVNIPTAWTVGPNPLTNLTFNTLNAANNLVSFIATPPNVVTSLNGGTATDVTNVTGTGVAPGTTLKLDGGAFIDTLIDNAGGLIPTVSAGALPGEIIITLPGFGSVDAVNYEQINITNVGPLTVTPTANPLNSVEGFNYVNAPVGSFTTTIPTIFPTTPAGLPASSFTSTVDWGDPSPDNTGGTITQDATNSNNYFVAGSHTYTTPGAFTDTLSVAFSGGPVTETVNGVPVSVIFPATAAATSSNTATVTQGVLAVTAFPIVGTEGAAIAAAPIATFIDAGGADAVANYTATINIVNSAGTTVLSVPAASIVQIGNSAE